MLDVDSFCLQNAGTGFQTCFHSGHRPMIFAATTFCHLVNVDQLDRFHTLVS